MRRKLVTVLCICLSAAVLTGCGNDQVAEQKAQLVKTQTVSLGGESVAGTYAGVVKGRYETNMSFQVGGNIMSRNVQLGDRVRAGDVLMIIDAKDVAQKSNQADAQVASAKAQLVLAQNNLSRYSELYAQQAIPESTLDQFQASYDAALAAYENAVAAAAQGHNALGYTNLVAPADGVVSAINAEAGQVVAAGQTVLTLVQTGEYEIEFNIPENHLADVSVGKQVQVSLWALGGQNAVSGVVREISPMADPVARTYKIRVSLPNPPQGLQLGMTASVVCRQSSADNKPANTAKNNSLAATLPLSAIYQTGDTTQVWVVDKDSLTLSLKQVKVVEVGNNKVQVSGLNNGDIVVTAGVHKLREGDSVRLSEGEG